MKLIESESITINLAIDKRYYSGRPDIYCEYKSVDGSLIFEIKSQRAHEGIHKERRKICNQLKRYLSFRKTRNTAPKEVCDVNCTFHSADVEYCLKEFLGEDNDFESYLNSNLCFLGWDIVDMIPESQMRIRYFQGRNDQAQIITRIQSSFNGYANSLSNVLEEMQKKNIRLLPQNDQSIIVMIIEKAWELYNPEMRFVPKPPNPRIPREDYFLEGNTLYFSVPCMDWALNGKPTETQPYCAKIRRMKIRQICKLMSELGLLDVTAKLGMKYYGSSIFKRPKRYDETVCQALAEYLYKQFNKDTVQKTLRDFLPT